MPENDSKNHMVPTPRSLAAPRMSFVRVSRSGRRQAGGFPPGQRPLRAGGHVPLSAGGIFLVVFLACLLAAPFWAMAEAPPIQSAAEIDYPPFSFVNARGEADGFSVELMRAALKAMNREVVFRKGPWAEVRGWLERGDIQALPLVGRTPERERLLDFTFAYMTLHGAIVVRKDNKDIHQIGDLRGRQVAVMKGDNAEEFLRREERGIHINTTITFEKALRQLSEGRYDAVVIQRLVAIRLIQEMGLTNLRILERSVEGFRQDFCFAVKESDRDTLALLNDGLSVLMADGTYRRLHAKWFAALQLPTNRPIIIGGDQDYPPFEYLDQKGRPAGFTVDLSLAIARQMNMDIRIRLGPWSRVLEELRAGDIDAIQGIFYSPERAHTLAFSPSYLVSQYVSIVRPDTGDPPETIADLSGKRLVVEAGDLIHDFLVRQGLGDRVSVLETQEEVLKAVSEGRYNCGIVPRVSAMYLIREKGWANLVLGGRSLFSGEYCYAVPRGETALLAQFSEGLKVLQESGEYRRIYEKWLGGYKETPPSLMDALRYSAMVLIPLILLLLAAFLWSWTLRRQVASRTRELHESSEFQRAMIACSPVALYGIDLEGKVLAWNESAEKIFGWKAEEVIGNPLPIVPQGKEAEFEDLRKRIIETGAFSGVEVFRRRKDGTLFIASLSGAPIYNTKGEIVGKMASAEDITQRKQADAALRKSEEKLRFLTENMADIIWTCDLDLRITYASLSIEKVLGFKREERTGQTINEWLTPASLRAIKELFAVEYQREQTGLMDPERSKTIEVEYYHKNGGTVWLENTLKWLRDSEGTIIGVLGVARDISERKRGEAEREKLRQQFFQAQKMESVGRLAGGVAHDFNNKLTVILGYTQMALEDLDRGHPLYGRLQQVMKAGEQSVQIVRQLLAFARKQIISPDVLDLNETVEDMLKMLRRLIGEDIDLAWEPGKDLWPVKMDPSQIDQVLANLCVNARDAISAAGKLTIETENVVLDANYCADHAGFLPGDYVMLAVSDNGCGMDKDTLTNAFEPFFTTKEVGKGTGLGLSTVYGIVKQNNGFVNLYSEPGRGTTVKIYLPRYRGEASGKSEAVQPEIPSGHGETILVVEDDAPVLHLARRTLENLGYGVLTSANPADAIRMAREHHGDIHLLVTDVILPEMSGKELAGEITTIRPSIRILYMSGYTANVIAHQGVLEAGVHFIGKPFTLETLARKVREVLGAPLNPFPDQLI